MRFSAHARAPNHYREALAMKYVLRTNPGNPKAKNRNKFECPNFQVGRVTPVRAGGCGGQGTARPTWVELL